MEEKTQTSFLLSNLVTEGLIQDDTEESYAISKCGKDTIWNLSLIFSADLPHLNKELFKSNKRNFKFAMEFLAGSLSLPLIHIQKLQYVRDVYRDWFEDLSFLGDVASQNKYLCRILKQLTQPFGLAQISEMSDNQRSVYSLLISILDDFNYVAIKQGRIFEDETWRVLIKCIIGITDDVLSEEFSKHFSDQESTNLQQKAVDVFFSSIYHSGISDRKEWELFTKYCHKWSSKRDFLKQWGVYLRTIFNYLFFGYYKEPPSDNPFNGGIYSDEHPISVETVTEQFYRTINALDQKQINQHILLAELANTMNSIVSNVISLFMYHSKLLYKRGTTMSFFKFFGHLLTIKPPDSGPYDSFYSVQISTLLTMLGHYKLNDNSQILERLIVDYAQYIDTNRPKTFCSFISNCPQVFCRKEPILTYLSRLSLDLITKLNAPGLEKLIDTQVCESVVNLIFSSTAVLWNQPIVNDLLVKCFNVVWLITQQPPIHFRLICAAYKSSEAVFDTIISIYTPSNFEEGIRNPERLMFYSSVLSAISISVRTAESVRNQLKNSHSFVINVFIDVQKALEKKVEGCEKFAIASLHLIDNINEWNPEFLRDGPTIEALFAFIGQLKKVVKNTKKTAKKDKGMKAIQTEIRSVMEHLNIRTPHSDMFTHVYGSSLDINESFVCKKLNIEQPIISYFTVSEHLLLSFIEDPSGNGPLVIFSRGEFGKSVWIVRDDYEGQMPIPKQIPLGPEELPPPPKLKLNPIDLFVGQPPNTVEAMTREELEEIDAEAAKRFKEEYSKWRSSGSCLSTPPFLEKGPYQRRRVIDFLVTTGLLDIENKNDIRAHKDVSSVITELDQLETRPIIIVPIIHVMNDDVAIEWNDNYHSRHSPALQKFLTNIGVPMVANIDPELRMAVPTVTTTKYIVAFVCPSMAKTMEGAKKIFEMAEKSEFTIIFNDTDYEINSMGLPQGEGTNVIIQPTLPGLYFISLPKAPKGIMCPFGNDQAMKGQMIGFAFSVLCEQISADINQKYTVSKKKNDIFKKLCQEPDDHDLMAKATVTFK